MEVTLQSLQMISSSIVLGNHVRVVINIVRGVICGVIPIGDYFLGLI